MSVPSSLSCATWTNACSWELCDRQPRPPPIPSPPPPPPPVPSRRPIRVLSSAEDAEVVEVVGEEAARSPVAERLIHFSRRAVSFDRTCSLRSCGMHGKEEESEEEEEEEEDDPLPPLGERPLVILSVQNEDEEDHRL